MDEARETPVKIYMIKTRTTEKLYSFKHKITYLMFFIIKTIVNIKEMKNYGHGLDCIKTYNFCLVKQ